MHLSVMSVFKFVNLYFCNTITIQILKNKPRSIHFDDTNNTGCPIQNKLLSESLIRETLDDILYKYAKAKNQNINYCFKNTHL